jgi:hypothetical protein
VKTLGILTTAITTAAVAIAIVVVVRSAPDIRRYLKIREM